MKIKFLPSTASGTFFAPPSKSMSHRAIICAGLSNGISRIDNVLFSDDVKATLSCIEKLGAEIEYGKDFVKVKGTNPSDFMPATLNCHESASTLRFLIPLSYVSGKKISFVGSKSLFSRPLDVYKEIADSENCKFDLSENNLSILGKLSPKTYTVKGDISSQFISGLLFALPLLNGNSKIILIPPVESRPYIDMTIDCLKKFGIDIIFKDETITITGNQKYTPCDITIEGDCSSSAFFDAFNFMGGNVDINGLSENTKQGDRVFHKLFSDIKNGVTVNISDCPDLGPIAIALSAILGGGKFFGTKRLSLKESNRTEAMQTELKKLGISSKASSDSFEVLNSKIIPPTTELSSHNDHRIAMALSIILSKAGGVLDGAEAVSKSFPDFFDELKKLNVKTEVL